MREIAVVIFDEGSRKVRPLFTQKLRRIEFVLNLGTFRVRENVSR